MTKRLVLTYLALTVFVLLVLEIPLGVTFARQERAATFAALERDAGSLGALVEDVLETKRYAAAEMVAADYEERTGARVVIVDADGLSVVDTSGSELGRDFTTRPEFASALIGRVANGVRLSDTLGERLAFVATPISSGGVIHGAVRLSYPATRLEQRVLRNWLSLGLVGLTVMLTTSLVGWLLARSVTGPIRSLEETAVAVAEGDLNALAQTDKGPREIRELARTFNEMEHRIRMLVETQRSFIAEASHQLRTPLTALRLRLENLEHQGLDPEGGEDLEGALEETARLGQMVDDLLRLARIDAVPGERVQVDVGAVCADRIRAWEPLAAERTVSLTMEGDDDGPVAWVVSGGLEQILDNFLSNALSVAPEGSTVVVEVVPTLRRVEVHVIDEGPGLTEEALAHAFDRFWRAPGNREKGSGLGLAIARRLAEASGGTADLEPVPAGGLDAVVRLRPVVAPG